MISAATTTRARLSTAACAHDPAVWIGEVALRFRLRLGLLRIRPRRPFAVLRVFGFVHFRHVPQQLFHFLAQAQLGLVHAIMADRLVLAGVGFDLGAVDGYVPRLHRRFQVALTECRDGVVVGMRAGRTKPEDIS